MTRKQALANQQWGTSWWRALVYVSIIMEHSATAAKQLLLKTSRFMKVWAPMCSFWFKAACFDRQFASVLWVLLLLVPLCSLGLLLRIQSTASWQLFHLVVDSAGHAGQDHSHDLGCREFRLCSHFANWGLFFFFFFPHQYQPRLDCYIFWVIIIIIMNIPLLYLYFKVSGEE